MDEYNHLSDEEKLKAENDFLKMKLALERDMHLSASSEDTELPPDVENKFLKSIIEFERQFDTNKKTVVFDKIGRPTHFLPVDQLDDAKIEKEYKKLVQYLNKHGIDFNVLSPNITTRELYRFLTEEFFEQEIDDINVPGMIVGFIYDEFYPDPFYENERLVRDDVMRDIFRTEELFFDIYYNKTLIFNDTELSFEDFKTRIQRFKNLCTKLNLCKCEIINCSIQDNVCIVEGSYKALAFFGKEKQFYQKDLKAQLSKNELGFWEVTGLWLENFNP